MLTATYSLVAVAAEQEKTRSLLHRLQQFVEASWKGLQSLDFGFFEAAYSRLQQFDRHLHNRKMEVHLIPALRSAGREAELLVADLDALSAKAGRMLQTVGRHLAERIELNRLQASHLCECMHAYCRHVATRLQIEEQVLLPQARRLLSVDDWFRLAAEFLARDGHVGITGRRRRESRHPAHDERVRDLH